MTAVSIVIPTFNGGARLGQLLDMVHGQATRATLQIIAVDSGSTDGSLDVLRSGGGRSSLSVPARSTTGPAATKG